MRPQTYRHASSLGFATLAGLAVFAPCVAIGTVLFWQCVDFIKAERQLRQVGEIALREAALPRATRKSTLDAATQALRSRNLVVLADEPQLMVSRNLRKDNSIQELESGDEIQIILGAYAADIAPDWLAPLGLSLEGRKIRVTMTTLLR